MIVFVVGIYKSGTSMVTDMIQQMGMPSCVEPFRQSTSVVGNSHTYNILESYEVNLINNDIFRFFGYNEMYFDSSKFNKDISDELKRRIIDFYKKNSYDCVIKDPRFISLLPYWIEQLEGVEYRIVYVTRDHDSIVTSFTKDKWFIGKVVGENYDDAVAGLEANFNRLLSDDRYNGLQLDYDFIVKYKEEVHTLIVNFIESNDHRVHKIHFASYFDSASNMKQLFSRQCPYNIPVWKNMIAVDSQPESDYIIIQDKTTDGISDKSKVVFFGREPKHVPGAYRRWTDESFLTLHHEDDDFWLPQTWWLDVPFNELETLDVPKTKTLSVIDSGKTMIEGHSNRIKLIRGLESNGLIDVYGKINGKTLPIRDKKDGILDYKYYLAIENGSTDNYFSEKFCDAVLCNSYPLYWGCKSMAKWFPNNSFYWVDITKPMDYLIDEVRDVIDSDRNELYSTELQEAKKLILYKYNIWPTIYSKINT